jgi:hypothetical protein
MYENPGSPLTYLTEIMAASWKHGGELAVAVGCVVVVGLTSLGTRSLLHLQDFGGTGHVVVVLLPPIGAVLLLEAAVAAWRVHRSQQITLATTGALLDLNACDRADLERQLHSHYRGREARTEERYAARMERLADQIAALQSGAIRHPHRSTQAPPDSRFAG